MEKYSKRKYAMLMAHPCKAKKKGPFPVANYQTNLVAGEGFEPSTFGL